MSHLVAVTEQIHRALDRCTSARQAMRTASELLTAHLAGSRDQEVERSGVDVTMLDELREYVAEGIDDDWIYFSEIMSMMLLIGEPRENLLRRAGDAAMGLVREGFVVPGELTEDAFVPWTTAPEESAMRIDAEVSRLAREGTDPYMGEICWFDRPN